MELMLLVQIVFMLFLQMQILYLAKITMKHEREKIKDTIYILEQINFIYSQLYVSDTKDETTVEDCK